MTPSIDTAIATAFRGDGFLVAQRRFKPGTLCFPMAMQGFGQPIEGAFRRRHVPQQVKEFFPLFGGQMRYDHAHQAKHIQEAPMAL
jgi:hypothetical protein